MLGLMPGGKVTGNGQSDEQFMAKRSLDTAQAFLERIDGTQELAGQARQACEAAWDAGWYSRGSSPTVNPFRGKKGPS